MSENKEEEFADFAIFNPIEDGIILKRDEKGTWTNIPHVVTHHSPSGYEWGYGGSGPADLALNIVEIILNKIGYQGEEVQCFRGSCWDLSWRLHQEFKRIFIAPAPREGCIIPYQIALSWIQEQMDPEK